MARPEYVADFVCHKLLVDTRDGDKCMIRVRSMLLTTDHPNPLVRQWKVTLVRRNGDSWFSIKADGKKDRNLGFDELKSFLRAGGFTRPELVIMRLISQK